LSDGTHGGETRDVVQVTSEEELKEGGRGVSEEYECKNMLYAVLTHARCSSFSPPSLLPSLLTCRSAISWAGLGGFIPGVTRTGVKDDSPSKRLQE